MANIVEDTTTEPVNITILNDGGKAPLPKRYMISAALPYANGLKHIGHLAGAYLPADIYVRYLRAQKRDVVFVSGSDEHGRLPRVELHESPVAAQGTAAPQLEYRD